MRKYNLRNIREVNGDDIHALYEENAVRVLVGCAPCQPFSQMRFKLRDANERDEKYDLLLEFGRLIEETHPTIISMENVPKIRETDVYETFLNILARNGYNVSSQVVYCPNYGIPQTRRRFVLVASLLAYSYLSLFS